MLKVQCIPMISAHYFTVMLVYHGELYKTVNALCNMPSLHSFSLLWVCLPASPWMRKMEEVGLSPLDAVGRPTEKVETNPHWMKTIPLTGQS